MRAIVGPPPVQQALPEPPEEAPEFDIRAFFRIVRRYKVIILCITVIGVCLAALVTLQLRQQFTAAALVVVDDRDSQILGFEPDMAPGVGVTNQVDTEVEVARSAKVGERAAIALGIANWPEFRQGASTSFLLRSLFGLTNRDGANSTPVDFATLPDTEQARLVGALMARAKINRVGLTSVISIGAIAYDPATAARMANALADAYLTEQISAKIESNERAATFLRQRVESLASDIGTGEQQLNDFITKTLGQLGSPEAKALLLQTTAEAQQQQASSEALASIQAALAQNDYDTLVSLAGVDQANLAKQRQALVAQINGDNDPARLADAQKSLDALNDEIKTAAEQRSTELQDGLSTLQAQSAATRQQIAASVSQLQLPQDVSVQLFRMQQDSETRRSLYDSFLTKLRQVEQQTDFNLPDSRVIASATPPSAPSFPPFKLILAGAFIFSLGAGIGLAFLRENFIGGITSVEQFEGVTGLPVVAAVPRYESKQANARPDLAIVTEPLSAFSESIRRIRLGLDVYGPKTKRTIFVTSALPGDGKTTIAVALARHLAMTGTSTLLIDADLRHPTIHRLLGEKVDHGLIDFLAQPNPTSADQIHIVTEGTTGAHFVLGSDASAVATDALLMSTRFDELMRYAQGAYDVVMVDTPPIGLVVDATIVARHCDLGIFVAKYAVTGQGAVRASLRDMMRRIDLPVCCVLNCVDRGASYQYGYGGSYQRYYQ